MSVTFVTPAPTDTSKIPFRVALRIRRLLEASTMGELIDCIPDEHLQTVVRWIDGPAYVEPSFASWRLMQAINRACAAVGIDPHGERARKRRDDVRNGVKPVVMAVPKKAKVKKKKPVVELPDGVVSLDAVRERKRVVVVRPDGGARRAR